MLVGHVGAALAAKAVEPRLNLGTLVAAALFLDLVFWCLVLAGIESVQVPQDFAARHFLTFVYPWSHSLAAAVLYGLAFSVGWAMWGSRRARRRGAFWDASALLALVVISHWLLDALVHVPDLPLLPGGGVVGLGLWQHQPWAFIVELLIAVGGLAAFLWRSALSWPRLAVVGVLTLALSALTAMGAFGTAPPPSPDVLAASSLGVLVIAIAVYAWCDRTRRAFS